MIQVLMPLPWLRGLDGRLRAAVNWRDPAVKQVFVLMMPVTIGLGLINFNAFVDTLFASRLLDPALAPSRDRRRLPPLHAPAGAVLGRRRDGALPVALAVRRRWGHGALPATRWGRGIRQIAFLLVPASVCCRRARGADRPARLPARRVHRRADGRSSPPVSRRSRSGSRSTARCLCSTARSSRSSRRGCRRRSRSRTSALNTLLDISLLPGRHLGNPARHLCREHRRRCGARDPAPPPRGRHRNRANARRRGSLVIAGRCAGRSSLGRVAGARRRPRATFFAQLVAVAAALAAGGVVYIGACWLLRVREARPLLRLLRLR